MGQEVKNLLRAQSKYGLMGSSAKTGKKIFDGSQEQFLGGLSLHLNHLYSIAIGKLRLAIWDTSFWTFWLKFGHKGH